MKKIVTLIFFFTAFFCNARAAVTLDEDLKAALPSGEFFLPAPPEVGSLIWLDDSTKYFQYKKAAHDSYDSNGDRWDSIWAKMNEPYDFALYRLSADSVMNAQFISATWTRTKANKYTVTKTRNTTDFPEMNALQQLCEAMKEENTSGLWRTRPRPYKYFGEWYAGKKYAVDHTDATSYPSGHGYFAGLFTMCMMYIDPANALKIKKMMDEWMECRLVLGAHWNTDLSAGWQLGAIAFSIAMNYDQFRNQVEAAKTELKNYRATHPLPVPALTIGDTNTASEVSTFLSDHNGETLSELEITRPVLNNMYNTLCLPFSMDADQIAASSLNSVQIYEFTNAVVADDELYLYVSEPVNTIVAGKPYFVQYSASSQLDQLSFADVTISNADLDAQAVTFNGVTFKGTFAPFEMPAQGSLNMNGGYLFLGANNQLYWPSSAGQIKPFRAYLYVDAASAPAGMPLRHGMPAHIGQPAQTPTGIGTIQGGDAQAAKVIERGALHIIKGSDKYDAQGKSIH